MRMSSLAAATTLDATRHGGQPGWDILAAAHILSGGS